MPTARRLLPIVAAVAVLAAACGDTATELAPASTVSTAVTTASPAAATEVPASTVATDGGGGTEFSPPSTEADAAAAPETPPILTSTIDGPEAPHFALTLGTGTDQFVLGEVNRPVYLVFWADW